MLENKLIQTANRLEALMEQTKSWQRRPGSQAEGERLQQIIRRLSSIRTDIIEELKHDNHSTV